MLNAMRTWNAWFALWSEAVLLGFEAQAVVALRLVRFAGGGAKARSEANRMYTEKVQALGEAHTTASIVATKRGGSHHVAKKVLGVYKKRVRRNRRRLTRW
jgi:hypothetical protein